MQSAVKVLAILFAVTIVVCLDIAQGEYVDGSAAKADAAASQRSEAVAKGEEARSVDHQGVSAQPNGGV
ncbi:hypothetical protein HPB47_018268 [Ixodes persulcatus]|uniref:Uncharacterized protein n=1 Tax=Ixodes persulcatus TaxID=34615 RepID=A0AC60QLB0_IXOPE|nr:hypothetical protein HPB47_018268 [Ixodes persulcatus]